MIRDSAKFMDDMADGEKSLQNMCSPRMKLLQKNQQPHRHFLKMYSTNDEIAKDHVKINCCAFESLSMEN